MPIPKNYFHDRLVLFLLSVNVFLTIVTSLLILFRLRASGSEGFIGEYHANLGLSAYKPGTSLTFVAFIGFAVLVLVLHSVLSMKMYHRRRQFSVALLWMGMLLLLLALIVSNALLVLQ